jgi:hypothetical protein
VSLDRVSLEKAVRMLLASASLDAGTGFRIWLPSGNKVGGSWRFVRPDPRFEDGERPWETWIVARVSTAEGPTRHVERLAMSAGTHSE